MARPREFDLDIALDRAMHVFWAKGYEGASLQDLLDAMGIARGSLYKAFPDKRAVYLAALDRYDRTIVEAGMALLRDPVQGDGVERIRRLFLGACEATARGDRRGCFMCNAAVDQAPLEPAVQERVLAITRRLEVAIAAALAEGATTRRWSARRRVETACLLTNAYMGLRVLAKAGRPTAELEAMVAAMVRPLRPTGARTTARPAQELEQERHPSA